LGEGSQVSPVHAELAFLILARLRRRHQDCDVAAQSDSLTVASARPSARKAFSSSGTLPNETWSPRIAMVTALNPAAFPIAERRAFSTFEDRLAVAPS